MGSRQEATPHQPLISSLVVRPSESGGGGGDSDYEPGEVRHDASPPYSRSNGYSDESGYRTRAVSVSPVRRRDVDRSYSPDPDRLDDLPRHRGFGVGREILRSPGRYRDYSPPQSRGRVGRPFRKRFGGPGHGPRLVRGAGVHMSNLNVRPREGDWYCADPMCGNLNFARREYCNKCKRFRYSTGGRPRRGFGGPPPPMGPSRRFLGPPMSRSPVRFADGYRSPSPRGWPRDGPRDPGPARLPPSRHEGRFVDHHIRRERLDYPEEDFKDRGKFERPGPPNWGPRHHGRESFLDRAGYERRPVSPLPPPPPPPPAPPRGRWPERDIRERSRSPIRAAPPSKEFRRDAYMERGRNDRRGAGRDRIGNVYQQRMR